MNKTPNEEERNLYIKLTGHKERLWRKLQDCYDLIKYIPEKLLQFKIRVDQIHSVREKFTEIVDRLFVLSNNFTEFATDVVQLESNFDALYFEILAVAGTYDTSQISGTSQTTSNITKRELSIRDIHLPKFDGRPEEFPSFRAMFDAMVHNTTYTEIEKFTILINHLEGPALKYAQTIRFSPENYMVTYNQLVQRYTNKRLIANHYLRTIFSLNPIKNDSHMVLSELCEALQTNVTALRAMQLPDLTDYIFLQFSLRLLDVQMKEEFEKEYLETEFPSFKNVIEFLRNKCSVSQLVGASLDSKPQRSVIHYNVPSLKNHGYTNVQNKRVTMTSQNSIGNDVSRIKYSRNICSYCSDKNHFKLNQCSKFIALNPKQRHEFIKTRGLCYACFNPHHISKCRVKINCRYCSSNRHNTLLHEEDFDPENRFNNEPNTNVNLKNDETLVSSNTCEIKEKVAPLLATARVLIKGSNEEYFSVRAVLDSGSQVNFITASLAHSLGLSREKCRYEIKGVGQSFSGKPLGKVECSLKSTYKSEFTMNFEAVVLPRIVPNLPFISLLPKIKQRFDFIPLADPDFDISSPVDILLGVQAVLDVTLEDQSIIRGKPTAYLTTLGWVILGDTQESLPSISQMMSYACVEQEPSLNEILMKFWETEQICTPIPTSEEDEFCEKYFSRTTERNERGEYIVRLPFKTKNPKLGENRHQAISRFLKLESRFKGDRKYSGLYAENIKSYVDQGHLIPASETSSYIMTHHGVSKENLDGIKIRVVFNPAEKDTEGHSLNEYLHSGPKLHNDISAIVHRFRLYPVALTCDICQMFRCIILHPNDRKYFHIFWRFQPTDPITEWEHTRLIFGSTSSPFLAMRTLKRLVDDEGHKYPLAAKALNSQAFVDDILSGAENIQEACDLKVQLLNLLARGGFNLGKWGSSHNEVINQSNDVVELTKGDIPSSVKVLGIIWNMKLDCFQYKIQEITEPATKRGLLSRIARTFDINGYISPFIFLLKTLIQELWIKQLNWDEPITDTILEKWLIIKSEINLISSIQIPRYVLKHGVTRSRLIGFSDASKVGMAAVIYVRNECESQYSVNLIAAKTRVAPIKPWTIPRLELGAAHLLSKLMRSTLHAIGSVVQLSEPICFVDSTTVLGWIRTPPYQLNTFVANRVVQILDNLPSGRWCYVPGEWNPADPASRGLTPKELIRCDMWWKGPDFLLAENDTFFTMKKDIFTDNLPEIKETRQILCSSVEIQHELFSDILERFSSLSKIQRILAYILRFCYNCARRKNNFKISNGPLTSTEYSNGLSLAIRVTQAQYLSETIKSLENKTHCPEKYRSLSPFFSPTGLIMVGGRLRHSKISFSRKHPYLIPNNSRLAILICDYYHIFSCHGGPRLVQSLINRLFWIPNLRRLIRSRIFRCITCYRFQAKPIQPPMGDLPKYRLEPTRCFTHAGLDFAGPFEVKVSNLRNQRFQKCYIALFICMVSRAIHIEFVGSLTTEACLAALDRFISRRGLPTDIYSDQGSNFRGAAREISEIKHFLEASTPTPTMSHYLAVRGITWHHNPPYAPHMGGLWEAGIKSVKYHLKRVVGNARLHIEPFLTTITRIEAILNSRPFCSLPSSPEDDLDPLTPGHFLIGGPLLSRQEVDLTKTPTNRLVQWQLSRQLVQSFWKRWHNEYIQTLQKRPKWTSSSTAAKEGDLVMWYHPNAPPLHWPLGRIENLIPGSDGIARVARIKTTSGYILRPLTKVSLLPPP